MTPEEKENLMLLMGDEVYPPEGYDPKEVRKRVEQLLEIEVSHNAYWV